MSAFTSSIQHSIRSPSHSNQTRKRNKRYPIGKQEIKLSLFRDDMISVHRKSNRLHQKLLNQINEFGKTAEYKVNTQKSKALLYTNNETSETEIRRKKKHLI